MKLWLDERFCRRLWAKIVVRGPDDCWLWTAYKNRKGYGRISVGAHSHVLAHRAVWVVANRKSVPRSKQVMHSCDVRACCNPRHLKPGTNKENRQDCVTKGRHANICGAKNPSAKLSASQVRRVFRLNYRGVPRAAIAVALRVTPQLISCILLRQAWSHLRIDPRFLPK